MKVTKLLTFDSDVVDKAKEMGLNVSGECNEFLKKKVGQTITAEEKVCKCGATKDLLWLCPYEIWICDKCAVVEKRKIIIGLVAKI